MSRTRSALVSASFADPAVSEPVKMCFVLVSSCNSLHDDFLYGGDHGVCNQLVAPRILKEGE